MLYHLDIPGSLTRLYLLMYILYRVFVYMRHIQTDILHTLCLHYMSSAMDGLVISLLFVELIKSILLSLLLLLCPDIYLEKVRESNYICVVCSYIQNPIVSSAFKGRTVL